MYKEVKTQDELVVKQRHVLLAPIRNSDLVVDDRDLVAVLEHRRRRSERMGGLTVISYDPVTGVVEGACAVVVHGVVCGGGEALFKFIATETLLSGAATSSSRRTVSTTTKRVKIMIRNFFAYFLITTTVESTADSPCDVSPRVSWEDCGSLFMSALIFFYREIFFIHHTNYY